MHKESPRNPPHVLPLAAALALVLIILLPVIIISPTDVLNVLIRVCALSGTFCLTLAAISSAFVMQISKLTRRPFKQFHHILAISGVILITLHPLFFAWQMKSFDVFIPQLGSWPAFLSWGGRIGIILIYLALIGALLMRRIPRQWRYWHWLVYPSLLLGGIHALRMGQDIITSTAAQILAWTILALTVIVFLYKRWHQRSPPKIKGTA